VINYYLLVFSVDLVLVWFGLSTIGNNGDNLIWNNNVMRYVILEPIIFWFEFGGDQRSRGFVDWTENDDEFIDSWYIWVWCVLARLVVTYIVVIYEIGDLLVPSINWSFIIIYIVHFILDNK